MADILKVTTPLSGYDNSTIKNNPQAGQGIHIQNPIDPSKVMRGDNRTDSGGTGDQQLAFQYGSNFGAFLNLVKNIPDLSKIFADIFFQGEEVLTGGIMGEEAAQKIASFFEATQMQAEEILPFIKEQTESAVRFNGGIFDQLRQVMAETTSVDLKAEVLNFIRKFNDMSSGKHILHDIFNTVKDMEAYVFKQTREQIESFLKELDLSAPEGQTSPNSALLKEKLLPFLGRYIAMNHDMGTIRDKISLLTVLIARYENGDRGEVLQSFSRLTGYQGFRKFFGSMTMEQFGELLHQVDMEQAAGKNQWADKFIDFLKAGVNGDAGLENKQMFQNILQSMVLNESVYMPLIHLAFPMNVDGRKLFSEMWIDPDEEGSSTQAGAKHTARIFVKFDIRELGQFKLLLLYGDNAATLQLYYPEKMQKSEADIHKGIKNILDRHHFRADNIYLQAGGGPSSPVEVFPKIHERKNSVDVRI
ncbi:hypothetical protein [Lacrimispora saccharolytica]|uniref:Uncharacterized protein n=1 Tax=Lacrimispora saccharolytica (strain ATCC 35040 / DSM 2544 / NRCC 2533 / WM1) TaxID=610130 RepID=D9R9X6_LACSW|nr:hypothetical protein [Lacrimispora saccharolytica]ADL05948.1 hypothetical protein Closa_3422 [[Clostridium] saccharolyticum WM1]QRV19921.1 hypothetical protein I6K70_21340 [Lacrimispora saccharolytica]